MPAYQVKMISDDDALDDACTMTATIDQTNRRAGAQRNALKFANKISMKAPPGKRFVMRLHDSEWEKSGTMSRSEMRAYINELKALYQYEDVEV